MKKSLQKRLSFSCIFIGLITPAAFAEDGAVPKSLIGLWAHSEADCRLKTSGALDNSDKGNWQKSEYEFVGICRNGIDLLYQPIFCAADKVQASGVDYDYSGRCRVKDYPPSATKFKINHSASGISFNEKEFENSDFALSGEYVRCTTTYKCEGDLGDK